MKKILLTLCLFLFSNCFAQNVNTYIPPRAFQYLPILKQEILKYWPDHPVHAYFGSLIEHESCISLTHSRCWSPTSELRTARELGQGFTQFTKAYNSVGGIRFDALTELKNRHPNDLRELNWNNLTSRPDLQLRATMLKSLDNWKTLPTIKDKMERLAMIDNGWNAGMGAVNARRRACGMAPNCNPNIWFGHVEKHCTSSRAIIYGKRNACDIQEHHVRDVLITRLPKYKKYL